MNEDNLSASRRRRVKRIKVYLVVIFLLLLISPSVISIFALVNLRGLDAKIEELSDRVDRIELTYILKSEAAASLEAMDEETAIEAEVEEDVSLAPIERAEDIVFDERDVPEGYKSVYLTFDDGPSIYTSQILDVLDTYGVKATFFVTGIQAKNHPEWYKEIVDRGHTIGMHSYSHIYNKVYADEAAFEQDLDQIHDFILDTTGVDCKVFRFPGGSSNHVSTVAMSDLCELVHSKGYEYYDWNVSSQDATTPIPGAAVIVNNVVSGTGKYERSIVLMHDAGDKYSTVQALPAIIEGIQKSDKAVILPIGNNTEPIQHLGVSSEE